MKVLFLNSFKNDLKKIKDYKLRQNIKSQLLILEDIDTLNQIHNIVKMKGQSTAYRIRIGDYRLGIFYEDNTITIARFLKRNDIYKLFP